jgi:nitric oxide reductase NorD protein
MTVAGYRLLARAVAGRDVNIASSGGSPAYSDGASIYLDEQADPGECRRTAMVQAALLGVGSLDRTVMSRLAVARKPLVRRYLTLEVVRACHRLRAVLPRCVEEPVGRLHAGPVSASAEASLARAASRERIPAPPGWFGTIRPIKVLRANAVDGHAPSEKDRRGLSGRIDLPELDDDEAETSDRSKIMELLSAPSVMNPFGAMLQRMLGMGRTPSGGNAAGELPVGGSRSGPAGRRARTMLAGVAGLLSVAGPPVAGVRYPEWDWARRSYRPDWCVVGEFDPPRPDHPERPDPHLATDQRLRRALARWGLTAVRHRGQADGDALDLTALVDFRIATAAGYGGEPRVYESRRWTGRDLGVLVLLDATGSTAQAADGRAVFEDQRQLAWQLTAVLDELGVRVASYAFCSRGRESVRFLRVKGFDDRFDRSAERRLLAVEPSGFTRLGAAYRHATELLVSRAGAPRLILVAVGDGLPYDDGYEGRYAREDSRRALAEALGRGVGPVGVRVRASEDDDDAMSWIWGEATHCVARDSGDLAREVRWLFGKAVRQATAIRGDGPARQPARRPASQHENSGG